MEHEDKIVIGLSWESFDNLIKQLGSAVIFVELELKPNNFYLGVLFHHYGKKIVMLPEEFIAEAQKGA